MFKNFIKAFKQTYQEINRDKITAKKYLRYLKEELILHSHNFSILKSIAMVLDYASISSAVSPELYDKYFIRLWYFLKYDRNIPSGWPPEGSTQLTQVVCMKDPMGIGYIDSVKKIGEEVTAKYNAALKNYHSHDYKECIAKIKEAVEYYNNSWKDLDNNHFMLKLDKSSTN
jgi:thiaminase